MIRLIFLTNIITFSFVSFAEGQSASPSVSLPVASYTPQPVYRPEWAKQGLSGKGVVLVTIDPKTGTVAGVRMLQSTGNSLLDGAALDAYSKWRFKPGSVRRLKCRLNLQIVQGAKYRRKPQSHCPPLITS